MDDPPDEICCQCMWLCVGRVRCVCDIEDDLASVGGAADVFGFDQDLSVLGNVYQMSK